MTDTTPDPASAFARLQQMLLNDAAGKLGAAQALPGVTEMMQQLTAGMAADSGQWLELGNRYYREQLALWQAYVGGNAETQPPAPPADRRFRAEEWREPYFSYLAHSYLLSANWLREMTAAARLDAQAKRKLEFYTRQLVDALSPANFPWSNPEAIKLAAATDGDSLNRGLKNLAADIDRGLV